MVMNLCTCCKHIMSFGNLNISAIYKAIILSVNVPKVFIYKFCKQFYPARTTEQRLGEVRQKKLHKFRATQIFIKDINDWMAQFWKKWKKIQNEVVFCKFI